MWLGNRDTTPPLPPLSSSPGDVTSNEWVTAWSKFNVVRWLDFGQIWSAHYQNNLSISYGGEFNDRLGRFCVQGGSRDPPTPFRHCCRTTPKCEYWTTSHTQLYSHELTCTPQLANQLSASMEALRQTESDPDRNCPYDGCSYRVPPLTKRSPKKALAAHIRDHHSGFEARPCEYGCDPSHLYSTPSAYQTHKSRHHKDHDSGYPALCTFPGCQSTTRHHCRSRYIAHLSNVHSVAADDIEKYLPKPRGARKFVQATCVEPGCTRSFTRPDRYKEHLSKVHNKTDDEIQQLKATHAVYQDPQPGLTRAPSSTTLQKLTVKKGG